MSGALRIIMQITGGRPMKRRAYAFTDIVSGKPVFYYTDFFGRSWLAENAVGLFRVKSGTN